MDDARRREDAHRAALTSIASLQRQSGTALADAVGRAHDAGMSWRAIGAVLGLPGATVYRQHQAGSPIVVLRPHQGGSGRRGQRPAEVPSG